MDRHRLTQEMLDYIQEEADRLPYGSIVIELVDHIDSVDIQVTERKRFKKANYAAGTVVARQLGGRGT